MKSGIVIKIQEKLLRSAIGFYESVYQSGQLVEISDKEEFLEIAEFLSKRGNLLSPLSLHMFNEFKDQLC